MWNGRGVCRARERIALTTNQGQSCVAWRLARLVVTAAEGAAVRRERRKSREATAALCARSRGCRRVLTLRADRARAHGVCYTTTLLYIYYTTTLLHYYTTTLLQYITLLHYYNTLHYSTLHYITLHYITLHYITLHYITIRDDESHSTPPHFLARPPCSSALDAHARPRAVPPHAGRPPRARRLPRARRRPTPRAAPPTLPPRAQCHTGKDYRNTKFKRGGGVVTSDASSDATLFYASRRRQCDARRRPRGAPCVYAAVTSTTWWKRPPDPSVCGTRPSRQVRRGRRRPMTQFLLSGEEAAWY